MTTTLEETQDGFFVSSRIAERSFWVAVIVALAGFFGLQVIDPQAPKSDDAQWQPATAHVISIYENKVRELDERVAGLEYRLQIQPLKPILPLPPKTPGNSGNAGSIGAAPKTEAKKE